MTPKVTQCHDAIWRHVIDKERYWPKVTILIQCNITVPHNSGISSELNIKCHLILLLKVNCENFRTLLVYSSEKTRMIGLAGGKGI